MTAGATARAIDRAQTVVRHACCLAMRKLRGGARMSIPLDIRRSLAWCMLVPLLSGMSQAETISPRRLLQVADFSVPVVSPDGTQVAYRIERASIERNIHDAVWYVQSIDGGAPPRPVGEGGVPLRDAAGIVLAAPARWSEDGRWIYYRALLDGRIDVWRAATNGSGAMRITTDEEADVRDFSLAAGDRRLSYSVGATRADVLSAEQAEYDAGIRIEGDVPIGQNLFRSGYVQGRLATQRFAEVWFDRTSLLGDVPDRWFSLDLETGARRASTAPADNAAILPADKATGVPGDYWKSVVEPGGGRVARLTRIGDGSGKLLRPDVLLSVDGREVIECRAEACTGKAISGLQWRPGHDEILFTVTDHDRGLAQSIHGWDIDSGTVRTIVVSGGLVAGGHTPASDCGAASRWLVCVAADADRPPRLERIDLVSGERHVLFDPNEALAFDMARSAQVRLLQWQDARGRRFSGQFYPARIEGEVPAPLFVTYYSCPGFVRGGVGDEWPLISLVQAGISALCINQLPGYTMDAVERHGEGLSAVESAIDLLEAAGEIDRTRVGMGGLSFGGAVTLWTLTESDLLAAASVANPVVSPTYYLFASLKGEGFFDGLRSMWGLGAPDETPERWRALSPAFKLDRFRAPVLFQHSEQEYMYALDYVVPLMREKRADLYVFPHEPHQKFQPRHKLAVYERNLDWFRFWLQGYEDGDHRKSEQYAHWRLMRSASCERAAATGGMHWYCRSSE